MTRGTDDRWLTRGVLGVGGASLFSDSSHEMVTSVLPALLTSTLHAGPAALGAIDGVADALTGLSKLAGGPLANDPQRRAGLASGGYLATAVATAAIGVTTAVWQVAILRALAWVSRGIRSPARDMLLTSLTPRSAWGRAFGVERAGDNLGAVVGPLAASVLVAAVGVRHTMLLAIVPGLLAAIAITVAGRETRQVLAGPEQRRTLSLRLRDLRSVGLAGVLAPIVLFELGNLASTLLILRATTVLTTGPRTVVAATSLAILLYAAHNAVAAAAALGGGQVADRLGPRWVFAAGAVAYVAAYGLFAGGARQWPGMLVAFVLAGMGIGFAETAESAVVSAALPEHLRSNGLGVLGLTQALGDLGATVVAGLLWSLTSPRVAFGYAVVWMAASLATIGVQALRPAGRSRSSVPGERPAGEE